MDYDIQQASNLNSNEEEEEEEGLFIEADAVNEETPSATALPRCRRLVPPRYALHS